jgi:hypothetical protein
MMDMKESKRKSKEALIYDASRQKTKHLVDEKFRKERMWVYYVLQSLLATFSILIVLIFLQLATPVIVAALGATAFVAFAMPKNVTAQPRNIVGGHAVGVMSGGICSLIFIFFGNSSDYIHIILASISVGLTIFIMVVCYRYGASPRLQHVFRSGSTRNRGSRSCILLAFHIN